MLLSDLGARVRCLRQSDLQAGKPIRRQGWMASDRWLTCVAETDKSSV